MALSSSGLGYNSFKVDTGDHDPAGLPKIYSERGFQMDTNERKRVLLGESPSNARSKLIKSILFSLLQKHGEDTCFRCGDKIEKIEELSIEHKESWQLADKPVEAFYDLENISFSHVLCNSKAVSVYRGWPKGIQRYWDRPSQPPKARTEMDREYERRYYHEKRKPTRNHPALKKT